MKLIVLLSSPFLIGVAAGLVILGGAFGLRDHEYENARRWREFQ